MVNLTGVAALWKTSGSGGADGAWLVIFDLTVIVVAVLDP